MDARSRAGRIKVEDGKLYLNEPDIGWVYVGRVTLDDTGSLGEVVGSTRHYVSTACLHRLHEQCRRQCKFCSAKCGCSCGHTDNWGDTTDGEQVDDTGRTWRNSGL
jgi:hypothetical protein